MVGFDLSFKWKMYTMNNKLKIKFNISNYKLVIKRAFYKDYSKLNFHFVPVSPNRTIL